MRSHFVPQCYLQNFGGEIYCYDKQEKRVYKSNPRNIAVKENFYGRQNEDKTNPVESAMCSLEGNASAVIKKILGTLSYSRLPGEEKFGFCLFVALQFLRTWEARMRIAQIGQTIIDAHAEQLEADGFQMRLTEEGEMHAQLCAMSDADIFASIMSKMGVVVGSNATDIPLWTSDNPVSLFNRFDQPFGNMGLLSQGIQVHVPLSPSTEVVFFDPVTYPKERIPEIFPMDKEHVIHRNHLQTRQSRRFMFSNTAEFFMANE